MINYYKITIALRAQKDSLPFYLTPSRDMGSFIEVSIGVKVIVIK